MRCACCDRDCVRTVALRSRADVALCRDCVEWLAGQLGVVSTPTLPVGELRPAIAFYERPAFGVRVYKDDDDDPIGDMPWGMREFSVRDPYGNQIRIGRGIG